MTRRISLEAILLVTAVASAVAQTPAQRTPNGAQLQTRGQNVKVQFYAEDRVRITKWPSQGTSETRSPVVIQKDLPELTLKFQEAAGAVTLSSTRLTVRLSKADGTVEFLTADNKVILSEQGAAVVTPVEYPQDKAFHVQQDFKLTPKEALYGLGQHQSGYMNYRGKTVNLVQSNTEAVTPFLISTQGWGILWDNMSRTVFTDTKDKMSLWSDVADNVDYYLCYGPSMDAVIAGYRALTGQAPMYGKWAYGYWQSKEHYKDREELLSVARQYRDNEDPHRQHHPGLELLGRQCELGRACSSTSPDTPGPRRWSISCTTRTST